MKVLLSGKMMFSKMKTLGILYERNENNGSGDHNPFAKFNFSPRGQFENPGESGKLTMSLPKRFINVPETEWLFDC